MELMVLRSSYDVSCLESLKAVGKTDDTFIISDKNLHICYVFQLI